MDLKQIKYRARPGAPMPEVESLAVKLFISQLRGDVREVVKALEEKERLVEMLTRRNDVLNARLKEVD